MGNQSEGCWEDSGIPLLGTPDGRLDIPLRCRNGVERIRFQIWGSELELVPAARAPLELMGAMTGERDVAKAPADQHTNLSRLARQYHDWWPEHFRTDFFLRTPWLGGSWRPPRRARRVASFFTGGVDSWFTLLSNLPELDAIVFVFGFDTMPWRKGAHAEVIDVMQAAADRFELQPIFVETDLRRLWDRKAPWYMTHGAALALVGHLLSARFRRIHIGATMSVRLDRPWGSHRALDPLWSTPDTSIVHFGSMWDRMEKLFSMCAHPEVLPHLRVCPKKWREDRDCGVCSKCVMTRLALELRRQHKCVPAFAEQLCRGDVQSFDWFNDLRQENARTLLLEARRCGDARIAAWLREELCEYRRNGGHLIEGLATLV